MKTQLFSLFILCLPIIGYCQVLQTRSAQEQSYQKVPSYSLTYIQDNEVSTISKEIMIPSEDPDIEGDTLFIQLDSDYEFLRNVYLDGHGTFDYLWDFDSHNVGYLLLPHGTYNIVGVLGKHLFEMAIVIHEDYQFTARDTIQLSSAMAENALIFDPRSVNNEPLIEINDMLNYGMFFNFDTNLGYTVVGYLWIPDCEYFISDFTGNFPLYFTAWLWDERPGSEFYLLEFDCPDTISGDVTLTNDPLNLTSTNISFHIPVNPRNQNFGFGYFNKYIDPAGDESLAGIIENRGFFTRHWECTLFTDLKFTPGFANKTMYKLAYDYDSYTKYDSVYSDFFDEINDTLATFRSIKPPLNAHRWNPTDTCWINRGPQTYAAHWYNSSNTIRCVNIRQDMSGSFLTGDDGFNRYFILNASGDTVDKGQDQNIMLLNQPDGNYKSYFSYSGCKFPGYYGMHAMKNLFSTLKTDPNPPIIRPIRLMDGDNNIKIKFESGQAVRLEFNATDFEAYDAHLTGIGYQPIRDDLTEVFLKSHTEQDWQSVPVNLSYQDTVVGSIYQINLQPYLLVDSSLYDLRISVVDTSDNSSEYIYSPAFVYGSVILASPEYQESAPQISLSPNPTHQILNIDFSDARTYGGNIQIYSLDGRCLYDQEILHALNRIQISVSELPQGIYVLQTIFDNHKLTRSFRFVKY